MSNVPFFYPRGAPPPLADTLAPQRSGVTFTCGPSGRAGDCSLPYSSSAGGGEKAGDGGVVHDHEGVRDLGEAREEARHHATLRTGCASGRGIAANLPSAIWPRYSMSAPQPA